MEEVCRRSFHVISSYLICHHSAKEGREGNALHLLSSFFHLLFYLSSSSHTENAMGSDHSQHTQHTAHSTQHTARSTQHTAHSTQQTATHRRIPSEGKPLFAFISDLFSLLRFVGQTSRQIPLTKSSK
jgi:hypothetical protein